jgi:hypothetical protein
VGYYIEPELAMKSNFFEVKRFKVMRLETGEGMQRLMGANSYSKK